MMLSINTLEKELRHSLACELHLLRNPDVEFWSRIHDSAKLACAEIFAKQIEALELALGASTPADKNATLFWISGLMDEPLQLSNGLIQSDR
jgi:hypothetical protein